MAVAKAYIELLAKDKASRVLNKFSKGLVSFTKKLAKVGAVAGIV